MEIVLSTQGNPEHELKKGKGTQTLTFSKVKCPWPSQSSNVHKAALMEEIFGIVGREAEGTLSLRIRAQSHSRTANEACS